MAGKTLYKFQDVQMILEEDGGYTCYRGEEIILRSLSWREALCSFFGSAQMQAERRMIKLEEERRMEDEGIMRGNGMCRTAPSAAGDNSR